jgi:hypothetical protein
VLVPAAGALATTAVIAAAAAVLPGGTMAEPPTDPAGELLAHVPASYAGSCVPVEGADNGVVCTPGAPATVEYYRFEDGRALDQAFGGLFPDAKDGGCGDAYAKGRLACWRLKGATALAWTDDGEKILGLAVGRGMQPPEMLRWWLATSVSS